MLFHSIQFLVFLPIVFALYWLVAEHALLRKLLLLVASAVFYMAWDPAPFVLVVYLATVDFFLARAIQKSQDQKRKKIFVAISVANNLTILGFFKYANLVYESVATVAARPQV